MFLPCQIERIKTDYETHRNNMFYKKIVTKLNKRILRATKRHHNEAKVYINDPCKFQFDILNIIYKEYEEAGYMVEIGVIRNSVNHFIRVSW